VSLAMECVFTGFPAGRLTRDDSGRYDDVTAQSDGDAAPRPAVTFSECKITLRSQAVVPNHRISAETDQRQGDGVFVLTASAPAAILPRPGTSPGLQRRSDFASALPDVGTTMLAHAACSYDQAYAARSYDQAYVRMTEGTKIPVTGSYQSTCSHTEFVGSYRLRHRGFGSAGYGERPGRIVPARPAGRNRSVPSLVRIADRRGRHEGFLDRPG
jgi:hypothetical protein